MAIPRLTFQARIMSYDQFIPIARPKSLLYLSTRALFGVVSKVLPENTRKVEWCRVCRRKMATYNPDILKPSDCNCFRYYKPTMDLLYNLPLELRHRTLEVAQKELDNSTSVQILLGKKDYFFLL